VQLLDPDGGAIPDPIGGPESVYRSALEAIRACITQRAAEWA
jgi:hypothetical protein